MPGNGKETNRKKITQNFELIKQIKIRRTQTGNQKSERKDRTLRAKVGKSEDESLGKESGRRTFILL